MTRLDRKSDVLADAKRRKQIGDLERPSDAGCRNFFRRMTRNGLTHQRCFAFVRGKHARQQIERCGFSGTIWTDQRMQGTVGY